MAIVQFTVTIEERDNAHLFDLIDMITDEINEHGPVAGVESDVL